MLLARAPGDRHQGFTLVELIAIIAVVSVMAAFAVPRFVGTTAYESRGTYDRAKSIVRQAQKIAIVQRQSSPKSPIYVVVTASQIRICYDAACASPVNDPYSGAALALSAPTSVAFSPVTTFSFDGSGASSSGSQIALNVTSTGAGDVNRAFYVDALTGYVHN